MDALIWVVAIAFAYWWHFQRETPREREYKAEQQRKATQWNKYNMGNQANKSTTSTQPKSAEKSEWDKHDMNQFK